MNTTWRVCVFFFFFLSFLFQHAQKKDSFSLSVTLSETDSFLFLPLLQIPILVQFAWAAVLSGGVVHLFCFSLHPIISKSSIPPPQRARSRSTCIPQQTPNASFQFYLKLKGRDWRLLLHWMRNGTPTYVDCFRNNESREGQTTIETGQQEGLET